MGSLYSFKKTLLYQKTFCESSFVIILYLNNIHAEREMIIKLGEGSYLHFPELIYQIFAFNLGVTQLYSLGEPIGGTAAERLNSKKTGSTQGMVSWILTLN